MGYEHLSAVLIRALPSNQKRAVHEDLNTVSNIRFYPISNSSKSNLTITLLKPIQLHLNCSKLCFTAIISIVSITSSAIQKPINVTLLQFQMWWNFQGEIEMAVLGLLLAEDINSMEKHVSAYLVAMVAMESEVSSIRPKYAYGIYFPNYLSWILHLMFRSCLLRLGLKQCNSWKKPIQVSACYAYASKILSWGFHTSR